eukprot:scaffold129656_cov36-Phaeocystis_antarctica.AAC.2
MQPELCQCQAVCAPSLFVLSVSSDPQSLRPSITVTSSPRRLYLLGVSCYCILACGAGPSYWRVGLALARLGENCRHWLEWPSGGKSPCFLAGRGA